MGADTLSALASIAGARLKASGELLVAAESCTGGWIGQAATAIAGSSEWFERGFVTYSNAAKQEMLGVRGETIAAHGAVSEETAKEMAAGALKHSRGTISVAVTGVAGPSGGSAAKPVGTVCFAWARGGEVRAETRRFDGDRESVRRQSVIRALQGLIEWLDEGRPQV
jgi:nicotinamide-nucleotide amidase